MSLSVSSVWNDARGSEVLAPHRAIYDISLEQASRGISEMSGRLVYELNGNACVGYTQKSRFVTRTVAEEGNTSLSDLRTSTWEDAKGSRMRFDTSEYRDEKPAQATSGEATRKTDAASVKVELTKPAKKSVTLRRNTLPRSTQHCPHPGGARRQAPAAG